MSPNTKKMILAIAIGVVVVAVPGALAFLDMRKVVEIETQTAALDLQRSELLKKKNQLEGLRKETGQEMVTFLRKKDSLPTGSEADSFVDKLAEFRQKAGIPPWEISKTQTRQASGPAAAAAAGAGGDAVEKYEYKINCKAKYHQLGHLLSQIEHWDRFIRVTALKVTDGGKYDYGEVDPAKLQDEAERKKYGDRPLTVNLELTTYFYPEVDATKAPPPPPAPPKSAKAPAPAGAPPVAIDPNEMVKLEQELLEDAKVEVASGIGPENEKVTLDKFLWPVEDNAKIRNPFNPLEALTPSKITVDEGTGPDVIGTEFVPITDAELPIWHGRIRGGVQPLLTQIREYVAAGNDLVEGGSEEELLAAAQLLDTLETPRSEWNDKNLLDYTDEQIKSPLVFLGEELAKRGLPPRPSDVKEKLILTDLQTELAALRGDVAAFKKSLDTKKVQIALGLSRKIHERMIDLFERGDYDRVRETFRKEMVPLVRGSLGAIPGVRDFYDKAEALEKRAGIRIEFLSIGFKLAALVVDEENPERSVFLVSGDTKARSVGEYFEVGKERIPVRVVGIGATDVAGGNSGADLSAYDLTVEYKGETIPTSQMSYGSSLQQDLDNGIDLGAAGAGSGERPRNQPKEQPKSPPQPPRQPGG